MRLVRAVTAACVLLACACDRHKPEPAPTPAPGPAPAAVAKIDVPFELLTSTLVSMMEHGATTPSVPREHALAYARDLVQFDAVRTAVFRATGRSAKAYPVDEPSPECIPRGDCFSTYLDTLAAKEKAEFGAAATADPARREALAVGLAEILVAGSLEREILGRLDRAKAALLALTGLTWEGPKTAKKVWLLDTGSDADKRRDASLARVRAAHPELCQVAVVKPASHPELFALIGARASAVTMIGDTLYAQVTEDEQWLSLLLGEGAQLTPPPRLDLPLIDAHSHIGAGGEGPLLRALDRNRIRFAVLAALPRDRNYTGLREANDLVLAVAKANPGRFLPLVMVSPLDPDPLPQLERDVAAGARGVKLMNGHGDYFVSGKVTDLDPPGLRKVFAYCEQHGLPILWHVNTHLFNKGFLRALKDFPRLKVVNPHLGGYLTYAPNLVRQLLDTYPNLYFDFSFGVNVAYLRRSLDDLSARHDEWRKLVIDHADRFLFGVDLVVGPTTAATHADMIYATYLGMLSATRFDFPFFPATGSAKLYEEAHQRYGLDGLALPEPVLRKVFADNALRIYGAPGAPPPK